MDSNYERMRIMGKDLKGKELGRGLSQRPDGRYMARAQVEGQPIVLYGWKLKELKKELALAVDEAKRSTLLPGMDGKSITLSEWFEEWYAKYKAPTLKGGGSPSYKRKFLNYFGVRIGSKFLADIRQLHVQTAIADMLEAGRTSKSVREATGILQNCVEAAIANGLMSINPVVGVIVPKCEKVERRVLSVEEQEIFLDYLARTKSWYEEMYQFMLLTGMRVGEVGGLQWEDIDFANKFIYVKRTLSYQYENGKKTMKLTSPKTENSVRKIPFFGETREILERQFEKVKRKRVDLGERWRQPEELGNLVFLTSMGSPIGRYSVESDMRYVTKQINDMFRTEALYTGGIPKKFERVHPHALRHTFATRCFEKGMTPRTVQEIMGHANYNTTVSYTHVLDDIKLKEAERLGDFLQNKNNDETVEYSGLLGIM
ncbi:site-specific integrase [Lachnospiraceae bacterium]|nr:site-specific integrase [Lachnospiraceae bacterium]NBI76944.1 site-specific integrase [Lachnospiraceae bacterium]